MPRLKTTHDLSVKSAGRLVDEFIKEQTNPRGYLWIDARPICRTKRFNDYYFHIVDKKIDHFYVIHMDGNSDLIPNPADCDGCKPV